VGLLLLLTLYCTIENRGEEMYFLSFFFYSDVQDQNLSVNDERGHVFLTMEKKKRLALIVAPSLPSNSNHRVFTPR
jgi:hypothetical protein